MLIAICDDTKADAEKIRFSLMDITDELETVWFDSGKKLIESVGNGVFYSLVYQDIYLGDENGMETARAIRELSPETQIIFVTTSLDHAVDAFRVQAADYLVKPCTEADIVKAFARVNMRLNKRSAAPIMITAGKEIHVFHPERVVKLESDKHYTIIYRQGDRADRVHKNFTEIAALFGERFIEIRRGLLVNPDCIDKISGTNVLLSDGSVYILPRAKKDKVIARYTSIILDNQI